MYVCLCVSVCVCMCLCSYQILYSKLNRKELSLVLEYMHGRMH